MNAESPPGALEDRADEEISGQAEAEKNTTPPRGTTMPASKTPELREFRVG